MVGWIFVTVCWFVMFEFIGLVLSTSASTSLNIEVCESEMFEPSCDDNEVIMIVEAKYGRMRLSRCVQVDLGYIGCSADVLEHLDSLCSGRRTCSLRIPDSNFDKANSSSKCHSELKTYLNVSYQCIEVESSGCRECGRSSQEFARTTQPSAFLGSIVSAESRVHCGSSKCPWNIKVPSGQTINITLFDFAREQRNREPPSRNNYCNVYAIIKEHRHMITTVCGGREREQLIYTSVSNSVEVQIISTDVSSRQGQFMLHYEAVGCPDIAQPDGTTLTRHGDRVEVRCRNADQKWESHCVANEWVGKIGTCPDRSSDVTPNPEGALTVDNTGNSSGQKQLSTLDMSSSFTNGIEVCESETFEPSCDENQVIMITEAMYGRMRLSRCAQVDYGYMGCKANVFEHLDSLCSGRRTCSLRVPDSNLDKAKSSSRCPAEFKMYLNVSYKCIKAVGCPDIAQPDGTILKRHGDRVEVRCRNTDQKWERHCVANEWVGETGTCPGSRSDVTPNPEGVLSVGRHQSLLSDSVQLVSSVLQLLSIVIAVLFIV